MTWSEFLAQHGWKLPVMALLLVGSGFFSGSETALFNLSRGELYRMGLSRRRLRRLVSSLMASPRRVLNTLLLGNLIVNTAFEAIAAVTIIDVARRAAAPAWAIAVASALPLVLVILAGEVGPKAMALATHMRWAELAAAPLTALGKAMGPVLWLLERLLIGPLTRILAPAVARGQDISADELAALLDLSAKRGVIGHDANVLLQEIVELTDLRAGDVMVPRVDMAAFDINDPPQKLVELFRQSRLRRIPVYDGSIDRILGIVHAKRLLLNPGGPIRDMIVKVPFVPEAANLERVLLQLRVTRSQMAVVVDEFGGVAGLVTLDDVLEEIVGDIPEPRSRERGPSVQRVGEGQYVLDGDLAIHEWADAFKIDLAAGRINTIGGFVTSLLGHIPHEGDVATYRNLRFTVLSLRRRRIEKLRLELTEAAP